MFRAFFLTIALIVPAFAAAAEEIRLYVFDCGSLRFDDVAAFGLTNDETEVREMFVPCYLVEHPNGRLFWDAGLPVAIVGQGDVPLQPGTTMRYDRSVFDQLDDIGVSLETIDYAAFSHMHFDHAGAANAFVGSTILMQKPEYVAAFEMADANPVFDPTLYGELADAEFILLEGDHDVFGDGSVRIIAAYGHTPGHQVLYVDLANTGRIVLSGDLYHFRFSRKDRRVPSFNTDASATLTAMDKVERLLEETGATLWIEHDKALADTLTKAPRFYD